MPWRTWRSEARCDPITHLRTSSSSLPAAAVHSIPVEIPQEMRRDRAEPRAFRSALKVLVTDGCYKHTLGIVRSLGRGGHHVTVLARSRDDLAARSRYGAAVECVSDQDSNNFVEAVRRILRRHPHDLVIPVGYATTLALAREKESFSSLTRLEIADYDQIRFAADKKRVHDLAVLLGISVPQTFFPDSVEAANAYASSARYPVLVKPRRESPALPVRFVNSAREFPSAYLSLCFDSGVQNDSLPIIQEIIPGNGCGFFALYQNGSCKRLFMHRRIRENPPAGGVSCCAESFYDSTLKGISLRLLDALNWHGVVMVEYRRDSRDGTYKLLEINPKFWGSLDLPLAAGVDFPQYLCQMACGEDLAYSEDYDKAIRYHWPLSGDLQHVARNPRSLPAFLADCLNPRVRSNIWLGDLGPNLSEVGSLLESGWRRIRGV